MSFIIIYSCFLTKMKQILCKTSFKKTKISQNAKIIYTPENPLFYYVKVEFGGV